MQVILTASDLAAMPTALRQDLLDYLANRRKPSVPGRTEPRREAGERGTFDGMAVLDHDQAIALVRDVSFGHKLKGLHDLLEALSYEKDADAPDSQRLAHLLKLDDVRRLRRYFGAIRRLLKQVTPDVAPIMPVDSLSELEHEGHGIVLERLGIAAGDAHQRFLLEGRFDLFSVTAQIIVAAARALPSLAPGAHRLSDIPPRALWQGLAGCTDEA